MSTEQRTIVDVHMLARIACASLAGIRANPEKSCMIASDNAATWAMADAKALAKLLDDEWKAGHVD